MRDLVGRALVGEECRNTQFARGFRHRLQGVARDDLDIEARGLERADRFPGSRPGLIGDHQGPGMGPIGVNAKLAPYLPKHTFVQTGGKQGIHAVSAAPFGSGRPVARWRIR